VTDEPYRPIACAIHDQLEAIAMLRHPYRIGYRDASGEAQVAEGRIHDIRVRGGAEFLVLQDGMEIRLDRILTLDGEPFGAGSPPRA